MEKPVGMHLHTLIQQIISKSFLDQAPVLGDAGDTDLSQSQALPSRNFQFDREDRDTDGHHSVI